MMKSSKGLTSSVFFSAHDGVGGSLTQQKVKISFFLTEFFVFNSNLLGLMKMHSPPGRNLVHVKSHYSKCH